MSAANKHISRYPDARKILLIGDVGRAFLDVNAAAKTRSEICADMPEAIDITARENFAAIAVVMSGISTRLSCDLKALRDNSDADRPWPTIILSVLSAPINSTNRLPLPAGTARSRPPLRLLSIRRRKRE